MHNYSQRPAVPDQRVTEAGSGKGVFVAICSESS